MVVYKKHYTRKHMFVQEQGFLMKEEDYFSAIVIDREGNPATGLVYAPCRPVDIPTCRYQRFKVRVTRPPSQRLARKRG